MSTKSNATTGSRVLINYQISTNTNPTNSTLISSYSKLMGILSEVALLLQCMFLIKFVFQIDENALSITLEKDGAVLHRCKISGSFH